MESMSVLERLSELLPALPPGLIEAWGQLVLFAVPVCLYLAAVVLPFVVLYGLIRAHFGRRSLLERCSRQQARFANFLNWLFLVCFVGLGLSKVVPYETFPSLYQAGLYLSAGLLLGGTIIWTVVVAAWKPLRGWPARFPRVSDRKQPRLPPHHRAYSGPRGLAGHGAAARERPSDADRSFAAFRQRSFLAVLRADPLP